MSVREVCARALSGIRFSRARFNLPLMLAWALVTAAGTLVAPSGAQAQTCVVASPLTYTALNQTFSLNASAVQACDELIEGPPDTWGGFFTVDTADAYNYFTFGLGIDDTGAPLAEQFSTTNATYEFVGDLSTDSYTVKLIAVLPGATETDTISLFMCKGPEAPADENGCRTDQITTISVTLDLPLDFTTTTLPNGTAGATYSQTLTAVGAFTPKVYSMPSGDLPAGVTLSPAGVISGTPTASGVFSFTARVTDSASNTDDQPLTLTIAAPTLVIAPTTLPDPAAGTAYSQTITASGGISTYAYATTAGALPTGLALAPDGVLSGTVTESGVFNFTVTATDSTTGTAGTGSQAYTLTVAAPILAIGPVSPPNPVIGTSYSQSITATGGVAPYVYATTAGGLPDGLALAGDGTLSGSVTESGTFNFTVTATDATTGTAGSGARAYTLIVAAPTLTLAPGSISGINRGDTVSTQFVASGGTAPYAYSLTGGSPPTGVTLSATGLLSGTANASGTFDFNVVATDSTGGGPHSVAQAISLVVAAPTITVTGLPDGVVYATYSGSASASGGVGAYSYSVTAGDFPPGLTMAADGSVTGTPTTPGTYNFTITATDSTVGGGGPYSGELMDTITIAAPTIILPAGSPPAGQVGVSYLYTIPSPTGGSGGYTFAVTGGSLPPGLTLTSAGGISGSPTSAGDYTFMVTATDGGGFTGTQTYTITVAPLVVVPTLTEWAMMLLATALAGFGALILNRRRTA